MTFFNCVSESRALRSDPTADIGVSVKHLRGGAYPRIRSQMLPSVSPSSEYPGGVCFSKSTEAAVSVSAMFSHKSEIPRKNPVSQMCTEGSAVCFLSIHLYSAGAFLNGISSVSQITWDRGVLKKEQIGV